jgi:hypothetical protein
MDSGKVPVPQRQRRFGLHPPSRHHRYGTGVMQLHRGTGRHLVGRMMRNLSAAEPNDSFIQS